jgi:chromate transporter
LKELIDLFLIFFKMGSFTFGGGYAMLPIIQEEIVNKRNWATDEEILDYYAIGQSTPGIIAVNTATFIGYNQKGILGGIIATLGIAAPSIIIITIIAAFFKNFQDYKVVQHAFGGIRVVVAALIFNTVLKMYKDSVKDWVGIFLFIISFLLLIFLDITPIIVIIISAIVGIIRFKSIKM